MRYQWQLSSIFNLYKVRWKVIKEIKETIGDSSYHYFLTSVYLYGQNIDHRQASYVINNDKDYLYHIRHSNNELAFMIDYRVNLSQMCLSASSLNRLYQVLMDWLNLPLNKIANQPLDFSLDLVEIEGQQLTLSFYRPPYISEISTQHLFKLVYTTTNLSGDLEFMVDHTCIQNLLDGLAKLLNE